MYRSFVTCDDPKGVVECGTIRKSKITSQKTDSKKKNKRTDKGKRQEMVPKEHPGHCSCQLLEVSKGAQKLNQLIDSWSKGLSYDGQSKDIAKELLKGALDLQESLAMLGKLQEASQYVTQLKKQQKEKVERGAIVHQRTDSDRFGSQNPRLSFDGSSRDCIEELRVAIKDGLARQNVLAKTSSQDKIRSHRRKMQAFLDIPSTSSSDSTHPTRSFMSETAKAPNLIAKLMGLDYIPSKSLMQPPQKQLEMQKISSPKRPVFEIEMPKMRRPQPVPDKVDLERRTLEEILETVQFQGLLKGNSAEQKSHSKQKLIDDVHPIVLIKPLHAPCFDSEEAEVGFKTKLVLRKTRTKEVNSNASKLYLKAEIEEIPFERVIQEVRTVEQNERAANANKLQRKLEAEKASVRRPGYKEGAKDRKEVTAKAEEKEAKKKWKESSLKMKSSNLAAQKQQKEESTDKEVDKVQKLLSSSKKPVEKTKTSSRSEDQTKLISTNKLKKSEKGSVSTHEHILQQRTTASRKTLSKNTTQSTVLHSSKSQKQKPEEASKPRASGPAIEDLDCREQEKRIDLTCKNHNLSKESSMEEKLNDSVSQAEEDVRSCDKADDETTGLKSENQLKDLLLSSLPFINLAEELFHLDPTYIKISPASEIYDQGVTDTKLSLDYAHEYIQIRSLPDSQTRHPQLCYMANSTANLSLDQLAEEVCRSVEILISYNKLSGDQKLGDTVYATLERDMMGKGIVSSIWNLGWRNGFSVDEVEQAVNDLEKLLVSELISEVFS